MSKIDIVKKAETLLNSYGIHMPNEAIARYQNCLSAQIFTLNQYKLMKRLYGDISCKVDLHHTAVFKSQASSKKFVSILFAKGYWIDSATRHSEDSCVVDFHHQLENFTEESLTLYVLEIVSLVEGLKGRYCNWDLDADLETKSVIASPVKHDKPITGIRWHCYKLDYSDYEDECAFIYQDQANFRYAVDVECEAYYSILDAIDVDVIMNKLRAGEGRIHLFRLRHFDDRYLNEVIEILQSRMYTTQHVAGKFSDAAFIQSRMGRSQVALELGVHALALGEDLMGEAQESQSEVEFAMKCKSEKLRRELEAKLPKATYRKSRTNKL